MEQKENYDDKKKYKKIEKKLFFFLNLIYAVFHFSFSIIFDYVIKKTVSEEQISKKTIKNREKLVYYSQSQDILETGYTKLLSRKDYVIDRNLFFRVES